MSELTLWIDLTLLVLVVWLSIYYHFSEIRVRHILAQADNGDGGKYTASLIELFSDQFWFGKGVRNGLKKRCNYLEPGDPYTTVEEAILWILEHRCQKTARQTQHVLKAMYQVQGSTVDFRVPDHFETSIQSEAEKLVGFSLGKVVIAKVEFVKPGEDLDRTRMVPVTPGSKVSRPLGVVLKGPDGNLISKARVVCI